MFDFSTLASFIAIVLGLFLIPGPAVLLVFSRTIEGGRRVGIATGLGIAVGDFVHTLFAAIGLSALLMTSALAFSVVKFAGAAYLIYLGVRAFLAKPSNPTRLETKRIGAGRAFLEAIPAEVLNPKTALFFLAFLPQFIRPEAGSGFAQLMVLGLIFVVLSSVYTALLALSVKPLGRVLKVLSKFSKWQGKVIGTIFVSIGLSVAMQER
jgi:threonine/homoserine/homoserine lactone efflux protein